MKFRIHRGAREIHPHIDGRPWFAKPSFADGKQVEIAGIDPDSRSGPLPRP